MIVVVIASTCFPGGRDLTSAQDGTRDDQVADDDSKATSMGKIRQVMTLRTDLSGSSVAVDRPFFLQLRDSLTPGSNTSVTATEVLKVAGGRLGEVDARTYEAGRLMTSWAPVNVTDGIEGAISRSGSVIFNIGDETVTIIMMTIHAPGTYAISVNASDAVDGTSLAPPVTMNVTVQDAAVPYLFDRPEVDMEYMDGWSSYMGNGTSLDFALKAATTALWKETEPYSTRYNWTVTVINPEGMIARDDMIPYNTGALLDYSGLVNTSVDSAWWGGSGHPFHVIWDRTSGVRMEGSAITTPTELGGGVWAAWMNGSWTPHGDGTMIFHQTGHYIFLFTLTKNGQAVSPPLVLETLVS